MLQRTGLAAVALGLAGSVLVAADPVNTTTCNGQTYTYQQLAGYGFVPGDAYDKYSDTAAGIGSSIAFERLSWRRTADGYTGTLWTLPDRGWNTEGTLNFQPRVHRFTVDFTPMTATTNSTNSTTSGPNIHLTYEDTVVFTDPSGVPVTGLDADATGAAQFSGFPDMPVATYQGDGFGRPGPGGKRVSVDSEGLVLAPDGSFWVSDEYGPYIYRFGRDGRMQQAIRPPEAVIPRRNGTQSFSANSPPRYDRNRTVIPASPDTGRVNNHGIEGLTVSPDGRTLYALLQAALVQEGGQSSATERYARLLVYDISNPLGAPRFTAEYVVPLPIYTTAKGKPKVAAQSEIHYVSPTQLFLLARDSGAGRAADATLSRYRHVDVIDLSNATNIRGPDYDCANCSIASTQGVLKPGIVPTGYCAFVDYNNNDQLSKFALHNGGAQDARLLNEKWESLALVPVDGVAGLDGRYYLFTISDDDFITQNGYQGRGTFPYADESGYNLDSQVLAFEVTLPRGARPLAG